MANGDERASEGCRVELLGVARLRAGLSQVSVRIQEPVTVEQLVPLLARRCPGLVGPVLDLERNALCGGHILCRNGREFLVGPAARVEPGDRLLLMSSLGGG